MQRRRARQDPHRPRHRRPPVQVFIQKEHITQSKHRSHEFWVAVTEKIKVQRPRPSIPSVSQGGRRVASLFRNLRQSETGAIDQIKHSLGPNFIPQPHQSKSPLTIQLMAMLLIFMGLAAFVMCPTVLAMEYLWKWLIPRLQNNSGNPGLYNCERIYEEGICEQCGLKQIRQKICIK